MFFTCSHVSSYVARVFLCGILCQFRVATCLHMSFTYSRVCCVLLIRHHVSSCVTSVFPCAVLCQFRVFMCHHMPLTCPCVPLRVTHVSMCATVCPYVSPCVPFPCHKRVLTCHTRVRRPVTRAPMRWWPSRRCSMEGSTAMR